MILLVSKQLIEIQEDSKGKIIAKKLNESYELNNVNNKFIFYESEFQTYPYTKIYFASKGEAIAFMIKDGFEVTIDNKKIEYAGTTR